MSTPQNGRTPSSGSSEHATPATRQLSFSKNWRPERLVQKERRGETDELWRRLDDLVTDASNCSPPCDSYALSTRILPCQPPQRGLRKELLGQI